MTKKVFLFDIDGTLLSPGLLPREILGRAFRAIAGGDPGLELEDVAGLTDPLIITNGLKKLGIGDGNLTELGTAVLDYYLTMMRKEYPRSTRPVLHTDAVQLLDAVDAHGHCPALLTGNVSSGARIKLDYFHMARRFKFGAYGDDSADRFDLPAIARQRAEEFLGHRLTNADLVIIGDTAHDARVASTCGCRSVIVGRQPQWRPAIAAAGADLIVDTLDEVERIFSVVNAGTA